MSKELKSDEINQLLGLTNLEIIDMESLESRFEDDLDLLGDLIIIFNEDSDNYLKLIQEALNQKNGMTLKKKAHAIKGSIINFDAPRAKSVAMYLEIMGIENRFSYGTQIVNILRVEIAKFVSIIEKIVKQGDFSNS